MFRRTVALVAVGAMTTAGLLLPSSARAADTSPRTKAAVEEAWADARCGFASARKVRDDEPITVRLAPAPTFVVGRIPARQFQRPASADPTWQLNLYSFGWLRPLAKAAWDDGQMQALDRIVAQIEAFYVANPDRGRSTLGWDEGSSLRRLENLNCLYVLTADKRLAKRMAQEVNLQFGPRYYGPPRYAVHNHGLMANLNVKRAGQLLGRKDWVAKAKARMAYEVDLAFSSQGTSMEQSAAYHLVNRNMWLAAAGRLEELDPADPTVTKIRRLTDKADEVGRWLTEPDRDVVQIGDSRRVRGLAPTGKERRVAFRDDEAGYLVGRWSWTDPETTYYTVRYGPPRWAHGHHDKGAVTWSTGGTRVLVGPGYYSYDWSNGYAVRARTMQAHNTSWPDGKKLNGRASAVLRSAGSTKAVHRFDVIDAVYGVRHTRNVQVDGPGRTLTVKDTYSGRTSFKQAWHLDPAWQWAGQRGKTLTFRHPDGRRLSVTTTGHYVSTSRGRTKPLAGWHHPTTGTRVPNWEILIRNTAPVSTTFQVR